MIHSLLTWYPEQVFRVRVKAYLVVAGLLVLAVASPSAPLQLLTLRHDLAAAAVASHDRPPPARGSLPAHRLALVGPWLGCAPSVAATALFGLCSSVHH